jgi:lipoprotein NlpD
MALINNIIKISTAILLSTTLLSCSNEIPYAPVTNGVHHIAANGTYVVQPEDTLYSIAWATNQDYRELAARNQIRSPYTLTVGQRLYVKGSAPYHKTIFVPQKKSPLITTKPKSSTPISKSTSAKNNPTIAPRYTEISSTASIAKWLWPVNGKIIKAFDPASGNKGINIAAKLGTPVHATAAGQVVYSGNGLAGYGNLIIIKHNDDYLSAYANNRILLVREGQQVKAGQTIAEVGNTGADQMQLHFEIRRAGKPVNPLNYL